MYKSLEALYLEYGPRLKETAIEVFIRDQTGRYSFPDNSILNNKTLVYMYTSEIMDVLPSGRTAADKNTIDNTFITLKSNANALIYRGILSAFSLSNEWRQIRPIYIDNLTTSDCLLEIDPAASPTADGSYLLVFGYID